MACGAEDAGIEIRKLRITEWIQKYELEKMVLIMYLQKN
jgi:hypothetical protein